MDVALLVLVDGGGAPEGAQSGRHEGGRYLGAFPAAARSNARTSSCVRARHSPGLSDRSVIGPMRVRTKRSTGWPDGLAHPSHLTVAALVDGDAQQSSIELRDLGGSRPAVLEVDPVAQPRHRAAGRLALDLHEVLLVHTEARVGEAVGEVAVVGEQQQPLRVGIEATDGEHPRLGGHQVDHHRASLRI